METYTCPECGKLHDDDDVSCPGSGDRSASGIVRGLIIAVGVWGIIALIIWVIWVGRGVVN